MRALSYGTYKKTGELGERNENEKVLGIPRYSSKIAESIKTFPTILRENGYFTFNKAKGDYNFIISDSTWSEYGTRKNLINLIVLFLQYIIII